MSIFQLIYHSNATAPMSDQQLGGLLEQARNRNQQLGITGLLLYGANQFVQVLEGPADAVREVYDSICRDERNSGNHALYADTIERREFPDWSMAFRVTAPDTFAQLPGFSDFLLQPIDKPATQGLRDATRQMLFLFKAELFSQAGD